VTEREDAVEQRKGLMVAERKGRKAVERVASKLERLEVIYVPINSVKANDYNPNRQSEHDFELLTRSMEEDGFTQPIVVLEDRTIVDGEHRWRCARRLGYEEIPVVVTQMTPEQMRIATLRHNRARGSEDMELSAQVLRDLETMGALDWAQDSLLISDLELQRLLDDIAAPDAQASDEHSAAWEPDVMGPQATTITTEGQLDKSTTGEWVYAGTGSAVDAAREREKKLREAKTAEQRQMIREDDERHFFRLALMFHGEEADVIRGVLGGAPAESLLALCLKETGETRVLSDDGWVPIDQVLGSRMIPAAAAGVLKDALDRLTSEEAIGERNRWQGIEYLAAEYLGGASHD